MTTEDTRTGAYEGAGLSDVSPPSREASAGRLPTGHEWIVLDIPKPPTLNKIPKRFGNSSPIVVKWAAVADGFLRAAGKYPRIIGAYELLVIFPEADWRAYDLDNRFKALCDWLQSREIIQNDRLARWISATWGCAPEGCRVCVRAWREA